VPSGKLVPYHPDGDHGGIVTLRLFSAAKGRREEEEMDRARETLCASFVPKHGGTPYKT
jgi:hypothetical protein